MKGCCFAGFVVIALCTGTARAQEADENPPAVPPVSLGELQPTPEMWFYQEALRRYDNPKYAVRERAAASAQQRQNRLAAQRWFGISKARPNANSTPLTSRYSAGWAGNGWNYNEWRGTGGGVIAIRPGNFGRY